MLRHFGVTPYIVFDGDFLPSKAATEASRARSRDEHRRQGMEYQRAGKPTLAAAEFQKSIDVTPEMARHFIDELKKMGVSYVVAPYEADAQMVYLERRGLVDGIVSEDSDLLVFGCRLLLSKLDRYGACVEINRRDFCAVREVSLTGWTDEDFRRMAILSGCDYLEGLRGTGLKTAYRLLRKHRTPEKVVQRIRLEGKVAVSENYLPAFYQAELTFLHQRVFCPLRRELVLLTDDPTGKANDMPFIGAHVEPELARAIARGDVNPITKEPIRVAAPSPKRQRAPSLAGPPPPSVSAAAGPAASSKPINSYFSKRSSRIPMGEMDRNCFAISSQRVADLTQNGQVPRVFPLPRPYLDANRAAPRAGQLRRRTEGISTVLAGLGHNSSSSSEANRRRTAGPEIVPRRDNMSTSAHQRPPKKARLCNNNDDQDEEAPASSGAAEKSKFFPSKKSKVGGGDGDGKTNAESSSASRRDDLLFSDDSIEEALMSLPTDDWDLSIPRQRKSFAVFDDAAQEKAKAAESRSEEGPEPDDYDDVRDAEQQASPSEKDTHAATEPERPTSTPPRLSSARVSLESFFYQPETQSRGTASSARTPGTNASATTTSSAPSSRASTVFTPSLGSARPETPFTAMTPLQRIGSRALGRHGGAATPSASGGDENVRGKRASLEALPVNPAFVPLPRVDLEEVAALNCGSEDLMPLFEEEGETRGVSLDLSRFLHR